MTSGVPVCSASPDPPQDAATSAATTITSPRSTDASLEAPAAEVGAHDRLVRDDLVDRPLTDHPTRRENGDAIRHPADEPQLVLDEHDPDGARGKIAHER